MAWDCRLVGSMLHQQDSFSLSEYHNCPLLFCEPTGSTLLIDACFVVLVHGIKVYFQVGDHGVTETIVEGLRKNSETLE